MDEVRVIIWSGPVTSADMTDESGSRRTAGVDLGKRSEVKRIRLPRTAGEGERAAGVRRAARKRRRRRRCWGLWRRGAREGVRRRAEQKRIGEVTGTGWIGDE